MSVLTPARRAAPRSARGFTLVELIVVILIVGLLAGIAVLGYSHVTDDAREAAARTQLREVAHAVVLEATGDSAPVLDRALVLAAIEQSFGVEVIDAGTSAAASWLLLGAAQTPAAEGEVSVGFRNSDAEEYTDAPGTQALLTIGDTNGTYSQQVRWSSSGVLLGEFTRGPAATPAVTPYGAMWVWDNSLTTEQDNRGTGYAAATPQSIVAFARQQNLSKVHISAPWVSNQGPIDAWMDQTTAAVHDAGMQVGVLGGDPGWLENPALAAQWATDAIDDRPVDYVELSLEPWTLPSWNADRAATVEKWKATIDAVRDALPDGVELSLDAPYWLATTPAPDGGTLFDVIVSRADVVSLVTFVDNAEGNDGILALSAPARAALNAAGMPYTIGVETDTEAIAGGADFTFYDDGPQALLRESELVAQALADDQQFEGVAVEHYRAWRHLLGMS